MDDELAPSSRIIPLVTKYENRGFKFRAAANTTYSMHNSVGSSHPAPQSSTDPWVEDIFTAPRLRRSFGDEGCLTLLFENGEHSFDIGGTLAFANNIQVYWKLGGVVDGRQTSRVVRAVRMPDSI